MLDDDFDDLLTHDAGWWRGFSFRLTELAANGLGQAGLWPVDDFVATQRYVPCPRRGTHLKITECWLCYGDWAWGHATASDVLAAGDPAD